MTPLVSLFDKISLQGKWYGSSMVERGIDALQVSYTEKSEARSNPRSRFESDLFH